MLVNVLLKKNKKKNLPKSKRWRGAAVNLHC